MAWGKNGLGYRLYREEIKRQKHARLKHYRCEACGLAYLRYNPHSTRCRAGLCEVCYEERKYALLCKCPRIRGDKNSVYACALCPEMQYDPDTAHRLVRAVWDEIDPRKRKDNPVPLDRYPTPEVSQNDQTLERNSAVNSRR